MVIMKIKKLELEKFIELVCEDDPDKNKCITYSIVSDFAYDSLNPQYRNCRGHSGGSRRKSRKSKSRKSKPKSKRKSKPKRKSKRKS